jgi:hypothetical protein
MQNNGPRREYRDLKTGGRRENLENRWTTILGLGWDEKLE